MIIGNLLLALHLLGAVAWVGGMAFALLVLRPSLQVLAPPQRLALHAQVFRRFFLVVWHAMPVLLVTGLLMVLVVYGGFRFVPWAVNVMLLTGLVMSALFVFIVLSPWRAFGAALTAGDNEAAGACVDRIRRLVQANLALGVLTVIVAAFAD
jgi:uncharacterized membrane protein